MCLPNHIGIAPTCLCCLCHLLPSNMEGIATYIYTSWHMVTQPVCNSQEHLRLIHLHPHIVRSFPAAGKMRIQAGQRALM